MRVTRRDATGRIGQVRKTYKLFIGGASRARSRAAPTRSDAEGQYVANAARPRARTCATPSSPPAAQPSWAARTAYNRGQVLYRDRRDDGGPRPQFIDELSRSPGRHRAAAGRRSTRAIDRLVWYAGWADKLAQVLGAANPVAGPFFNFSVPEPTGVVAVLAPQEPRCSGWSASSPR